MKMKAGEKDVKLNQKKREERWRMKRKENSLISQVILTINMLIS